MRLTREEFLERIKTVVGDDTSEESLSVIEDFTDTYNHLEELSTGQEDWKTKYEENDKGWREKYRDRFFNNDDVSNDNLDEDDDVDEDEPLSYDDLFEEREE